GRGGRRRSRSVERPDGPALEALPHPEALPLLLRSLPFHRPGESAPAADLVETGAALAVPRQPELHAQALEPARAGGGAADVAVFALAGRGDGVGHHRLERRPAAVGHRPAGQLAEVDVRAPGEDLAVDGHRALEAERPHLDAHERPLADL